MNPRSTIPVKPSYKEGASVLGEVDQHGLGNIQAAKSCKVMGDLFPCANIDIVVLGRKLGDPQISACVQNGSLRTSATQRGAGLDKLIDPFLLETGLIVLELAGGFLQRSQTGPGRSRGFRIIRKERPVFVQLEADRSHPSLVVDAHQEVTV